MERKSKHILLSLAVASTSILCLASPLVESRTFAQQPPPPFRLGETDVLKLDLSKPAKIQVLNDTAKTITLSIDIIDKGVNNTRPAADIMQPDQRTVSLAPAGSAVISVQAKSEVSPGTYAGYIVFYEQSSNFVARRELQLVVADPNAAKPDEKRPPKYLADKWKVEVFEGGLLGRQYKNRFLPLAPGHDLKTLQLEKGAILTHLVGDNGDTAVAKWDGAISNLLEDTIGLQLQFESLSDPGIYTGKIGSDPKSDKDVLTLTVLVAHHVFYAMLAISLGIGLALVFQRVLGVLRFAWALNKRRAQLGLDAANANKIFKEESQGKPYAKYELKDLDQKQKELVKRMDALSRNYFGKLDESNPEYQAISNELVSFEARVKAWALFAGNLAALQKALPEIDPSKRPPLYPEPEISAAYQRSNELLNGAPITLAEFDATLKEVGLKLQLLDRWKEFNNKAALLSRDIEMLKQEETAAGISDEDKFRLATARSDLIKSWYKLWKNDDYSNEEMELALSTVEETASVLMGRYTLIEPLAESFGSPDELAADRASARAKIRSPERYERDVRLFGRLPHYWNTASIVVAFLVALYTGLETLYFGKAFGTPRTYLSAIIWGFTTQSAVTAISAGLERLGGLRLPLTTK